METRIRWAAAQKRIAVRNSVETATDGYMLWDLFGSVRLMQHVRLQAGVENLLDQFYIDHLSVNSMPSPGRNLSVSLRITLRSEEHTSELQSRGHLVCRLLLEKKTNK